MGIFSNYLRKNEDKCLKCPFCGNKKEYSKLLSNVYVCTNRKCIINRCIDQTCAELTVSRGSEPPGVKLKKTSNKKFKWRK